MAETCGGVGHVDCETAVRCAVEVKVRMGLHQESALSPFFLTVAGVFVDYDVC